MDEILLLAKVMELHNAWWEAVWSEIAWDEHSRESVDFALTIQRGWDRFNRVADVLEIAGFDPKILVTEFETKGDPAAQITADEYVVMAERARCGC
jgi:hypothetical protein